MASRPTPPKSLKGKYRKLDVSKLQGLKPTQTFRRFTVIWTNNAGVPYNTTGFFAEARFASDNSFIQTVRFDSFGVAIFTVLRTPLRRRIIVRTFDRNGVLFRTRFVPAGVAAFVIFP